MSKLFGFQAGQLIGEESLQKKKLTDLALLEGQQNLQLGELKLESEKVALETAKDTRTKQQNLLKFLEAERSKGSIGTEETEKSNEAQTNSISSRLNKLAEFSMQAGLPEQAAKYYKTASEIDNSASLIQARKAGNRLKQLNIAAGLLENVTDERTFRQANLVFELETGEPSLLKDLDYSPEIVQQVKDSVTSQREKNQIKADKAAIDLKDLQEQEVRQNYFR